MIYKTSKVCLLTFIICLTAFAQTLTVRDIMREPSIAGMRPDSEKLSPDGKSVVFSWNAEGKEPRNLYIVSTNGGEPKMLVDAEKNYEMRTPAPENKLNYGVIVRDDFVKAREKNLGGAEFSPNSKRLLFTQNSDIYVVNLDGEATYSSVDNDKVKNQWKMYESLIVQQSDLIPSLIKIIKETGIQEKPLFENTVNYSAKLFNILNESPKGQFGDKSDEQKKLIFDAYGDVHSSIKHLLELQEAYPQLISNKAFLKIQEELTVTTEEKINSAGETYTGTLNSSDLFLKPRRITRTQGAEFAARWLDDATILYQSGGNFFALNIEKTSLVQLSKEANPQAFVSVSFAAPTEDAAMLAYVVSDSSKQRGLFVPNYLDEFVQAPVFRRGFSEQKVLVVKTDGSLEKPFEVKIPKAEGASYLRSLDWAADNRSLIVDRVDKDTKRRQLFYVYNVGGKDEQTILLTEETDEKWIGSLSRIVEPNPKDSSQILFASEKDGFNHLYLATLEKRQAAPNPTDEIRQENSSNAGFTGKVETKQLTSGNFEIEWANWRRSGDGIVYSSLETNTATREFYTFNVKSGKKLQVPSSSDGMKTAAQFSTKGDEDVLLFEFSRWNSPSEIYAQRVCPECRGLNFSKKLTASIPEEFAQTKWSEPQFISIKARDGKAIPAKIYLPANFDKSKKYPSVIFVHGAGYLQNVINGWNNYYREFMFNQLLTQKGYVILDIDYRGSAGYGRDFRTDVYDFLGGKDYEDHLDAIDFAVKNYAVDAKRIGVYGGSYGGFMAEMLAFRSDKVTCAAALRPVADWKNYYASSSIYTTERLGFPDKNPEGYKRSSPISYAENLNKPLLILHGLVDDNVPAQDSIQLIEKLIRLEKTEYFEAMLYPAENHGFTRPTSWTDEYERILIFFEKHLK